MKKQALESWQLPIYAFLHDRISGHVPARLQLEALETGEIAARAVPETMKETAHRRMDRVVGAIRREDWTPTPAAPKCQACSFRSTCEFSLA